MLESDGTTAIEASPERADYPSSVEANYVLGLLFLAYVFSFIDRSVLGVMVGPIKQDLQLSDFEFSLLQGAAFAILYSVMSVPFGRMADAKSRKWIMAAGVFSWSLMTIGCGLAKNFWQLFIMRMGVGVGEATLSPAAYSTITDSFPRAKLTRALAIYKAGMYVGGGLALGLGGALYDYFASVPNLSLPLIGAVGAWQATFITVGLPGFLIALLIVFTREPSRKGMLRTEADGGVSTLKISAVFHYMFVQHRQLYVSLFLGCSLLGIVSYGINSWFTEMLIRNFALDRSYVGSLVGSVLIFGGLIGVLTGPIIVGALEKRRHPDSNMRALMFLALASTPVAVLAPQMPSYQLALSFLAATIFFQAAYIGIAAAAVQMVTPNQMRGQATALYLFFTNMLGLALGSTLVASITDFIYADEAALMHSLSIIAAVLLPTAAWIFYRGLSAFASAMKRSEEWC